MFVQGSQEAPCYQEIMPVNSLMFLLKNRVGLAFQCIEQIKKFEIDITIDLGLNDIRPLQSLNFCFSRGNKRGNNLFPFGSNCTPATLELGCGLRSNASRTAIPKTKSSGPEGVLDAKYPTFNGCLGVVRYYLNIV